MNYILGACRLAIRVLDTMPINCICPRTIAIEFHAGESDCFARSIGVSRPTIHKLYISSTRSSTNLSSDPQFFYNAKQIA